MDAQHLDGNGIGGLLAEVAGAEMTTVVRRCQSCGDRTPIGEHRAYEAAGVVLRCPSCEDVAAVILVREDRLTVTWSGTYEMPRMPGAAA